jgi:hypothetical protein
MKNSQRQFDLNHLQITSHLKRRKKDIIACFENNNPALLPVYIKTYNSLVHNDTELYNKNKRLLSILSKVKTSELDNLRNQLNFLLTPVFTLRDVNLTGSHRLAKTGSFCNLSDYYQEEGGVSEPTSQLHPSSVQNALGADPLKDIPQLIL